MTERKNKIVSNNHIEFPPKKGKILLGINYFPTITALEQLGEILKKDTNKYWAKIGKSLIQDSYLFHHLLCNGTLPQQTTLNIKKYKKWCKEQKQKTKNKTKQTNN